MIVASKSRPPFPTPIPRGNSEEKSPDLGNYVQMCENLLPDVTDLQSRAIDLTVQGLRDTQIAQTLGIHRKTVWKWKTRDDDYRKALALARVHVRGTTVDRCENIAQQAMVALANFLDETSEPRDRLKAIQIALTTVTRFKPEKEKQQPRQQEEDYDDFPMPVLEPKVG